MGRMMGWYKPPEVWEMREGSAYWPVDSGHHELLVVYEYHCWYEGRPYGEGTMYERQVETSPTEFIWDGEHTTSGEMIDKLGSETFWGLVNQAME